MATVNQRTCNTIQKLNDTLRTTGLGGRVVITQGIASCGPAFIRRCVQAVSGFDDFTADNDPHDEHDCAVLDVEGTKIMFKIDYYDTSLRYASPNPSVEAITCRVMTVMLAREY